MREARRGSVGEADEGSSGGKLRGSGWLIACGDGGASQFTVSLQTAYFLEIWGCHSPSPPSFKRHMVRAGVRELHYTAFCSKQCAAAQKDELPGTHAHSLTGLC